MSGKFIVVVDREEFVKTCHKIADAYIVYEFELHEGKFDEEHRKDVLEVAEKIRRAMNFETIVDALLNDAALQFEIFLDLISDLDLPQWHKRILYGIALEKNLGGIV
jgi:hypothetical protein